MRILFLVALLLTVVFHSHAQSDDAQGYTYHHPSGNRLITGSGTFPDVEAFAIPTPDSITRLIALDHHIYSIDENSFQQYTYADGEIVTPAEADAVQVNTPQVAGLSVTIASNGDVVLRDADTEISRLPINARVDGLPVVSDDGLIAVYSDPSAAGYVHGIMGSDVENTTLTLLQVVDAQLQVVAVLRLPADEVFEGLSPLWADVDGDGMQDLITTVSSAALGAQIRVYDRAQNLIATGPAIGQGFRWRHQLAWGGFGENGEMGLIEVLTPHLGGRVGFFQLQGDQLVRTAVIAGFTSHVINSDNLDMAVGGDFNGDGQPEIVLPSQDRTQIAGLQVRGESFAVVWSLPLEGSLMSNLAASQLADGRLLLGAATQSTLHIWVSR